MNYLLKVLECLNVWVTDTTVEDHPLHIKQHVFQKGKSTETAISNTVNKIEKTCIEWGALHGCLPGYSDKI